MDTPQLENGYVRIANETFDNFCKIRIPGVERQILDCIIRKTYGWGRKKAMISIPQFQKMSDLKKQHVTRAISSLLSKNIIFITKNDDKKAHVYEFNKNRSTWRLSPKKVTSSKMVTGVTKNGYSVTKNGATLINKESSIKTLYKDMVKNQFKFKKAVQIPNNIFLTERMEKYLMDKNFQGNAKTLFEDFCIYHRKKGTKYMDWYATWQTWVRNQENWHPEQFIPKARQRPIEDLIT